MRVPDADEAFAAEPADLIGVIGNDVYVFDKFDILDASFQFWIDLRQVAAKEFFFGFLMRLEFRRWHDQPQTNDFVVYRDKPCPMKFLFVEDERVVFRGFAGRSAVAEGTLYMRKKSDLLVVASNVLRSGYLLVGEEGRHSGTIQNHLGFDVLGCPIGSLHCHSANAPIVRA